MTAVDVDPAQLPTTPPTMSPLPRRDRGPIPLGSEYQLEKPIGEGAAGRVWLGRRLTDDRVFAVKVLREEYASDTEAVARFLRERAVLLAVDHPNLVSIHDLVVEGSTFAIVMDYVDGADLRRTAARSPFGRDAAMTVLAQVAEALAAVHAAGVLHRDVKPENVLITWRGGSPWAQLTDFGIALVADGQVLTRHSRVVGTPAYLAPEVAMNRPFQAPSDVYALGITAYELLAGRRPFSGDHAMALLRAHVEDEPPRPDGIGDAAWQVVSSCLAKDPGHRPAAADLARRFAGLRGRVAALPADAPPPIPAYGRPPTPAYGTPPPTEIPAPMPESQPDLLLTTGATVPVPDAPPAPPETRRSLVWPVSILLAILLVAIGAGVWAGMPKSQPRTAASATPKAPASRYYYLPATVTSPAAGTVRIEFADVSAMRGFDSYVILRDGGYLEQLERGKGSPYVLPGVDRHTRHCYQVVALVVTDAALPAKPKPVCRTANGRATDTPR